MTQVEAQQPSRTFRRTWREILPTGLRPSEFIIATVNVG